MTGFVCKIQRISGSPDGAARRHTPCERRQTPMKNRIPFIAISETPDYQMPAVPSYGDSSRLVEGEFPWSGLRYETPRLGTPEPTDPCPRVGGKYRAVTGLDRQIGSIVGRDGAVWGVMDVDGRPVALTRVGVRWHAVPCDAVPPVAGDLIIHYGGISMVSVVHGQHEAGSWGVANNWENSLHVIRGEANHWMAVGDRRC
jgi:hypothetical protein